MLDGEEEEVVGRAVYGMQAVGIIHSLIFAESQHPWTPKRLFVAQMAEGWGHVIALPTYTLVKHV